MQHLSKPFLAAAMLSLSVALPAGAQDEKNETPPQPGWAVTCENAGSGLQCQALQTIAMRQTGQRLISVSVRRNPDETSAAMLLHLPHGLFLPAGLKVKIDDGKTRELPVQTCDARGCYAGMGASETEIAAMQKGMTLAVSFQNLEKKTITVNVPLAGFTAAYNKLQ